MIRLADKLGINCLYEDDRIRFQIENRINELLETESMYNDLCR